MLDAALILFVLGALAGLVMGVRSFRDLAIPSSLAAVHGLLVVSGVGLMLIAVMFGAVSSTLIAALVAFVFAAIAGFYLLTFHLQQAPHPRLVLVLHALLAATGVVLLACSLFLPA